MAARTVAKGPLLFLRNPAMAALSNGGGELIRQALPITSPKPLPGPAVLKDIDSGIKVQGSIGAAPLPWAWNSGFVVEAHGSRGKVVDDDDDDDDDGDGDDVDDFGDDDKYYHDSSDDDFDSNDDDDGEDWKKKIKTK